ncbi:C-type lectin 37Db-like [Anastrepha obliqua]|uniref:C-type lectin 37Db-like n=1 Tax=Anastrepha obliqua TaxID=95512 RepID=UPI00240A1BFB|nr:C-type lectin 37Db-like [Anastrepha obliqua]
MQFFRNIAFALVLTSLSFIGQTMADRVTEDPEYTPDSVSWEKSSQSKTHVSYSMPHTLSDNYIVTLIKLNWYAAYAFCEQNNWSLIQIETAKDQFEVQNYLNFFNLQANDFWTAGNNLADLRNFRWDYDGPQFRFMNWEFGQPDNSEGREHCVKLIENSLQWGDDSCENSYHFICQRFSHNNTEMSYGYGYM